MPSPEVERVQLLEADEITARAQEAGVPDVLAKRLGKAGGESRLPGEMLGLVTYLAFNQKGTRDEVEGLPTTDQGVSELLLAHYPGAVTATLADQEQRGTVLGLWEQQRAQLEAGRTALLAA
jgi:hypothetical protein